MNPKVYATIRNKTLLQYVQPYKVIEMKEIATAYGVSLDLIEQELADLITSGQLKAKIDSYKKLLHSRKDNLRAETYKQAIAVGKQFIGDTEEALLKIDLLRQDCILR